jgi:UDP-glucose 6-dehydrogenase
VSPKGAAITFLIIEEIFMNIAMIGSGYVGLVSGTCFSEFGFNVTCVDNDENKIEKLKKGIIPIFEPGLEKMVLDNYKSGSLNFTTNIAEAVKNADAVLLLSELLREEAMDTLTYLMFIPQLKILLKILRIHSYC